MTCAALVGATRSIRRGDHHNTNRMFRARIYAQAFTLVAVVAGSYYYAEEREKRKEFNGILAEKKAQEKREAWIRELEVRELEDREIEKEKQARTKRLRERERALKERAEALEQREKERALAPGTAPKEQDDADDADGKGKVMNKVIKCVTEQMEQQRLGILSAVKELLGQ